MTNAMMISFEGIEGSGKSTQIKLLKAYFEDKKYPVLLVREPGGTDFGEKLREAILHSQNEIAPLAEAHLFASSRAQLLTQKILPHLEQKNAVVLIDRYLDSSIAYQAMARGLGLQTILDLHSHAPLNTLPNMTFYLDISLEESMKRQNERGNAKDYFEKENQDFYKKLIEGYELAHKTFPKRVQRIDARKSVEEIQTAIQNAVEQFI